VELVTQEQAAQMINQNTQILAFFADLLPLLQTTLHDVMPLIFVGFSLWFGVMLGRSAT
jgi:hypothetical protein